MYAYSCVSAIESICIYAYLISFFYVCCLKVNYCILVTRMDINVTLTNTKKIFCNVVTRMDINVTLANYKNSKNNYLET